MFLFPIEVAWGDSVETPALACFHGHCLWSCTIFVTKAWHVVSAWTLVICLRHSPVGPHVVEHGAPILPWAMVMRDAL